MTGLFSPSEMSLSAEGRSIPMILLVLSNFLLKMRIHSYFYRILKVIILIKMAASGNRRLG